MTFLLGKEWLTLFDFVILHAEKPNFFKPNNDTNFEDKNFFSTRKLKKHQIYNKGNVSILNQHLGTDKILYLGDDFYMDRCN